MLCTASRGGMRSVVDAYRQDGLFDRHDVELIFTHDEGSVARRLSVALAALVRMAGLLLRGRVAALHAHMAMRGSFWRKSGFAALARLFGVPVIAHLHGSEMQVFYNEQPPWRQRLIVRQLEAAAVVLVLSRSWHAFVTAIAPRARVVELPNYVRVPALAPAAGAAAPAGTVDVLFLGAVGKRKGIYDLLPAFAKAHQQLPALRLRIGGTGEVEQAKALAQSLGVTEAVEFLGWVSGADKDRALAACAAYVLPSHNEGLPISVLEAMSWGKPVITTRVGGIPELVRDGIDGTLIDAGDVPALTQALLCAGRDADWRDRCGRAGRDRVAGSYSDAVILPQLSRLYDEVTARR